MDDISDRDTPAASIEGPESSTPPYMDSDDDRKMIRNTNEPSPLIQFPAMNVIQPPTPRATTRIKQSASMDHSNPMYPFTPALSTYVAPSTSAVPSSSAVPSTSAAPSHFVAPSAFHAPSPSVTPSTSTDSVSTTKSNRSTMKARLSALKESHLSVKLITNHFESQYRLSKFSNIAPTIPKWLNLRETARQLARLPLTNGKTYKLPIRRATRETAPLVKTWRANHATWREACNTNGKMPWLGTRSELFAIEVVEKRSWGGMPRFITRAFEDEGVQLGWIFDHDYVETVEPTGEGWEKVPEFWKGARIFDAVWRVLYMKVTKGKVLPLGFEDDLTELVREVVVSGSWREVVEEGSVCSENSLEGGDGVVVQEEVGVVEEMEVGQKETQLQERVQEERVQEERVQEERAQEEKLQERRRLDVKRKREKRQEEEKHQEKMREKQDSQSERIGETQNEHRNTSITHQQTPPAPQPPPSTAVNCWPMLKKEMMDPVKEVLRDIMPSTLGKRQLQEDTEDDDDATSVAPRKKQKTVQHVDTAEQVNLPSPPKGSETSPAKVGKTVETLGDDKGEDKIEKEMLVDLVNRHNAAVSKILKFENQMEEVTNEHGAMKERLRVVEEENGILRNQMTAVFHRLELVEKSYYRGSPQSAQGSPARIQPGLRAPRQPVKAEQQRNDGRMRGASFYEGRTYSRPSI
ncbi:uncharacterized protein PODANS_7_2640 [Podospora anserina S mat+]|uniref:Podospora anserina S mat+ genomic DNA chromosome 7, supercontig 1 n=1 Tax=Podospora anserina (strain S / ATCC MYA-4624 / DSM 980 / FGSC 10383) TaxID=515849 RepID=B2AVK4_PODAN|nr:uncharacterized protein PODANS_7_2640 [Podospora anserina S mat+]CAP68428.1 unnamed protein product [Podospora anserina S mat+]CDP31901.1 Putative protein of unknown function [Podospora anserina S mat+]